MSFFLGKREKEKKEKSSFYAKHNYTIFFLLHFDPEQSSLPLI